METAAETGLFKAEGPDRGGQTGEAGVRGVQSLRWDRNRSAGGSWSETGGKEGREFRTERGLWGLLLDGGGQLCQRYRGAHEKASVCTPKRNPMGSHSATLH